jgi:hypothetical protein
MKCLILAGGQGERLWPLSRKNYPKQFIEIQKNHSLFQETVSRNLLFCDEFIIVTKSDYRFIIEDQMKAFQGTPYRCVYDFDRRDKFGNPRELHLKKALDVLNFKKFVPAGIEQVEDSAGTVVTRCKYFEATVYEIKGETRIPMDTSKFTSIICMSGTGKVSFLGSEEELKAGESVFVPALEGVLTARGNMTLILSHV